MKGKVAASNSSFIFNKKKSSFFEPNPNQKVKIRKNVFAWILRIHKSIFDILYSYDEALSHFFITFQFHFTFIQQIEKVLPTLDHHHSSYLLYCLQIFLIFMILTCFQLTHTATFIILKFWSQQVHILSFSHTNTLTNFYNFPNSLHLLVS